MPSPPACRPPPDPRRRHEVRRTSAAVASRELRESGFIGLQPRKQARGRLEPPGRCVATRTTRLMSRRSGGSLRSAATCAFRWRRRRPRSLPAGRVDLSLPEGEERGLDGLHQVLPGQFTAPPPRDDARVREPRTNLLEEIIGLARTQVLGGPSRASAGRSSHRGVVRSALRSCGQARWNGRSPASSRNTWAQRPRSTPYRWSDPIATSDAAPAACSDSNAARTLRLA